MAYQQVFSGYDRSGRPVDQYGNPYYSQQAATACTDPYQRLQTLEQQYPQYGQTTPPLQQQPQQPVQTAPPQNQIMSVTGEQQARDCPADLSGVVQIFVMQDESAIFAKRFNPATALVEFETYERKIKESNQAGAAVSVPDNSFLLNMVGEFSGKLENMFSEIQALRKDVQDGYKPTGDSKPSGKQKSSASADTQSSPADDAVGK